MIEVAEKAVEVVKDIAGRLEIPPPRIVITYGGTPYYAGGTIYLPADLPPDMVVRVAAHEMAHHLHDYFGVQVSPKQAEAFAKTFEEVYVRMRKGYKYPVFICSRCGFRMFAYSDQVRCPKCGAEYSYTQYRYPDPGIEKALALAIASGLVAYLIATKGSEYITKYLKKELKPEQNAALAAGLAGLVAGLLL